MKPVYAKFANTPEAQGAGEAHPGHEVAPAPRTVAAGGSSRFNAPPRALDRARCLRFCAPSRDLPVGVVASGDRRACFQVFGRYVMNDTPTWTENLALVLVLYVTLIGAAVGVRDAGHIGMESLLVLRARGAAQQARAPDPRAGRDLRRGHGLQRLACSALGGGLQAPNVGLPEGVRYVPLVISGRAHRAVLHRAHHRARCTAPKWSPHGTDHPRVSFSLLLLLGRAGGVRDRAVRDRAPSSTKACRSRCSSSR